MAAFTRVHRHTWLLCAALHLIPLSDKGQEPNASAWQGAKVNQFRDDLLWHSETAGVSYVGAGNVSLVTSSRYGVVNGWEVSTDVLFDFWAPNATVKRLWSDRNLRIASKHGFVTGTPGLRWAQRQGYGDLVNDNPIPLILSLNQEVLVSKPFIDRVSCTNLQPWLIVTASAAIAFGIPFYTNNPKELDKHLVANRGEALTARGGYLRLKGWADWQISSNLALHGGLFYYVGSFTGRHALEQHTQLEYFFGPRWSVMLGYYFSLAGYDAPSRGGILPVLNGTFYFGQKENSRRGLFDQKVNRHYQNRNSPTKRN